MKYSTQQRPGLGKRLFLLAFTMAAFQVAMAQTPKPEDLNTVPPKDTTYWSNAFKFGASLTQASFSGNWKAGGINNISYSAILQAKADYIRDRHTWRSEADLQYGSVKNQGQDAFRKSLDKIFLDTKYGYAFAKSWSFYGSLNVLSQFDKGYKYNKLFDTAARQEVEQRTLISRFFAPGYVTESFGVEYKPVDYFFLRMGTGTLRQTIVSRPVDSALTNNYGVPFGKQVRNEVAFQLMASFEREVAKNIELKARYIAFLNYSKLGAPREWDHRLEFSMLAKVNKYISATVSSIAIYDFDADTKIQYSQTLGIGLLIAVGDLK